MLYNSLLFNSVFLGDKTCSGLLLELNKRYYRDREALMSQLKSQQSLGQLTSVEYARVVRQLFIMEEESNFISMATAVGLAERAMEPRQER